MLNLFGKKKDKPEVKKEETGHSKYFQLPVKEVIRETKDAITIVFDTTGHPVSYKAGQFFTIIKEVGGEKIRRAYSVCTSPYVDAFPGVTVKRVEGGKMSNDLNDHLKAGDVLEVMEPMGVFTTQIDPSNSRHVVLLGGGSGITPLMAIAKSVLSQEPQSKVSLIYANRNPESIIFKNALEQMHSDRFQVAHILEEKKEMDTKYVGYPSLVYYREILEQWGLISDSLAEYFICGPEGMMKVAEDSLLELQVPKEKIRKESFTNSSTKETSTVKVAGEQSAHEVTVIYDGEEYKFSVEPGKTILETALENDIDLPYSCQSGLCTACRGKCLSGKVKLDEEEGLSEAELKEGYVLTCVGHPISDDVVIEIG